MAFDEHRRTRKCIYCLESIFGDASKQASREHIFGTAIANLFPKNLPKYKRPNSNKQATSRIVDIASKIVCEDCNITWMKDDMMRAIPLIDGLMTNKISLLRGQDIYFIIRYIERFASLVDILSSNQDIDLRTKKFGNKLPAYENSIDGKRASPPGINDRYRKKYSQKFKIPNLNIYIGMHNRFLGMNPHVDVIFREGVIKPLSPSKRIIVVMKHFCFVAAINEPPFRLPNFVYPDDTKTVDLSKTSVSYDNIFALKNQDPKTILHRMIFADSEMRKEAEYYLKKGKYVPEIVVDRFAARIRNRAVNEKLPILKRA